MFDDITSYKEKIENKENKINELKEELKQLEKNIEANNRIFMRKYQKNSKPTKKNMFLFHSSRTGNNINKKQEIIIYKKNIKSYERKNAKSTPKIGTYINTMKNNYLITNSDKKNFNFVFYGTKRGKTLDYKNNKINLNNIKNTNNINLNKYLLKNKKGQNINNNMKQIKINSDIDQEIITQNNNNKYNKTEPNYIINIINNFDNNLYENLNDKIKNNIFVNKSITNTSSQNSYNNSKINRKDNNNKDVPTTIKDNYFFNNNNDNINNNCSKKIITEDLYKNIENQMLSVFDKYFSYYNNNKNLKESKDEHSKNNNL